MPRDFDISVILREVLDIKGFGIMPSSFSASINSSSRFIPLLKSGFSHALTPLPQLTSVVPPNATAL
jgi:hypothetical protein